MTFEPDSPRRKRIDPTGSVGFAARHLLLALPLVLGCAQALGLDDPATLGTGGVGAAATQSSSSVAPTAGSGPGCGMCVAPSECETAQCNGTNCQTTAAPEGTACTGGACDDRKKCIPAHCEKQSDCGMSNYCDGMVCLKKKPVDAVCQEPYECVTGNCKNSKCKP